jgi:hypothetical protein
LITGFDALTTLFLKSAGSGSNGDRLEFSYKDGMRSGPAVYYFADGSKEVDTPCTVQKI